MCNWYTVKIVSSPVSSSLQPGTIEFMSFSWHVGTISLILTARPLTKYLKVFQFQSRNSQVCEAQPKYTFRALKETKTTELRCIVCFVFCLLYAVSTYKLN